MKKIVFMLSMLSFVGASAAEITRSGSEAKHLFKGLKSVVGQTCENGICSTGSGMLSCSKINYAIDVYMCSVPGKVLGQVHQVMGFAAKDLYLALNEYKPAVCQMQMCVTMVLKVNCQTEDKWFPNYQCTVDVGNQ